MITHRRLHDICSFCHAHVDKVDVLITAETVCICNRCVVKAYGQVMDMLRSQEPSQVPQQASQQKQETGDG